MYNIRFNIDINRWILYKTEIVNGLSYFGEINYEERVTEMYFQSTLKQILDIYYR